jgi:hypothetical protein
MAKGAMSMLLAAACLALGGCLEDVLGVMLAPVGVVSDAANQVAATGAQTLASVPVGQLTDTAQALQDVDRLIKNNGDPDAQARLATLRDSLIANQNQAQGNLALGDVSHQNSAGQARRAADGMAGADPFAPFALLTVNPPGPASLAQRRPEPRPYASSENSSLRVADKPAFVLQVQPIRIGQ